MKTFRRVGFHGAVAGSLVALAACAGAGRGVAESSTPAPVAVQRAVISGVRVTPSASGATVHFDAVPAPRYRMTTTEVPPAVTLTFEDATLEGLAPRVEIGDGVVDAVEAAALPGGVGQVTIETAAPPKAAVRVVDGGIEVDLALVAAAPSHKAVAQTEPRVEVAADGQSVAFHLGSRAVRVSSFVLSDGRRAVVDADGVTLPEPHVTEEYPEGPIALVKMGRQEGRVRTVVEAREAGAFEGHRVEATDDGFRLVLAAAPAAVVAAVVEAPAAAPSDDPGRWATLPGGGSVGDLGFHQDADWSRIELELTRPAPHVVREGSGDRVVIDLLKTRLPRQFERALDTSAFAGPVKLVAAYARGDDTRLVIDLAGPTPFRVERDATHLTVAFEGGTSAAATEAEDVLVIQGGPPKPAAPETGVAGGNVYVGRRLSMDFVGADIRNVLRLIGEVSGLNVVAGDDVQGKVTVRLIDVPWDQALDVILKTRGLGLVREGNVIRIAPVDRLAAEDKRVKEAAEAAKELEPLATDIIPVNYAEAESLAEKVTAVLTERGTVSVDQRTNALLVKDVAARIEEARDLVAQLDTQTPEVLIEARIVEVSSTFSRDLGIQWGGKYTASTATGNATGWAFPHSIGINGDTGVSNYAVNFPSAGGAGGPGGALSMTLGHINDVFTLDLRLSAIESSGRGRVVSSPRVTTLDNKTAEISQGIEIPFTTATEEKIETQSIDYKLVLNVTPHVTADRSVIMKIEVTKDAPSTTFVAVDSNTPAKETRSASTQVLVKDGETTVIGGIITETKSFTESGIPWFRQIPGLGWLFKSTDKKEDKTELIIFITPKIVNTESLPAPSRSL